MATSNSPILVLETTASSRESPADTVRERVGAGRP
jgi:hypothetical protein